MKRWQNLTALAIILTMAFSFIPTSIKTPIKAYDQQVLLENNALYANGVAIVLKKGTDNKNYVYDIAGNLLLEQAITVNVIYGGSKNTITDGSTSITIENISGLTIYGGGYSDGTGEATVKGNTNIKIIGSCNAGTVYGGGFAEGKSGNAIANVTGTSDVHVSAIPSTYHAAIHGGGRAQSTTVNSATANVGATKVYAVDCIYAAYGGGYASSNSTGIATASVSGNVTIQVADADIREVYAAGYTTGANAVANCGSVIASVQDSELMLYHGGGYASSGQANVSGKVQTSLLRCPNLYGYVYGGGYAYNQSEANVGSVSLLIDGSSIPVDVQFGNYVAAGIYGGGNASKNSQAKVLQDVQMTIQNTDTAGTISGGGEAVDNSNSDVVGNITMQFHEVTGTTYTGVQTPFCSTVIAGGEHDATSSAMVSSSFIQIDDSTFDSIYGGNIVANQPVATDTLSSVTLTGENTVSEMYYINDITIDKPLTLSAFLPKEDGSQTTIHFAGAKLGDALIIYTGENANKDWFIMDDTELSLTDGKWIVTGIYYTIDAIANEGGSISPTGANKVLSGTSVTYTMTPNRGYEIANIEIDGKILDSKNLAYTFKNIDTNHSIKVTFTKKEVMLPKPDISISNTVPTITAPNLQDSLDTLLTEEDKLLISEGKDVHIALSVNTISTIDKKVKSLIEEQLQHHNIKSALYLDIQLSKVIEGRNSNITNTPNTLTFTMNIPNEYKKAGRVFSILRIHLLEDGTYQTTLLNNIGTNSDTITFETDQFSMYVLTYHDEEDSSGNEVVAENKTPPNSQVSTLQNNKRDIVDTGDRSYIIDYGVMMAMVFTIYMIIKCENKNKS